jgi:CheY-like chemotaxis protein
VTFVSVAGVSAGHDATMETSLRKALRILVVDDDMDAVETFAMRLRFMGHEVRFALTGRTALEAARAMRPEVVFLDLSMPGTDGYQVARALKHEPGFGITRIIATTGHGGDEYRRRAKEAGCDEHLLKPVAEHELTRVLEATV